MVRRTDSDSNSKTSTSSAASAGGVKRGRSAAKPLRSNITDYVLIVLAVVCAAALGGASAIPTAYSGVWALQILCVAGLVWLVSRASVRRSAILGLAFGTAWVGTGVWWLYISMHRYGGLSAEVSAGAVLVLGLAVSVFLALAMMLFAWRRRHRPLLDALLFAACWLLAELARGLLFTGFPWAASGYAHVDSPLAVLAPWVGVYGMGAVSALLAALMVLPIRVPEQASAGAVLGSLATGAALLVLAMIKPANFTQPTGTLQLSLLQPNVPQNEKFAVELMPQALAWSTQQMLAARGDLVVGPETVVPLLPEQLPPEYTEPLLNKFQKGSQAALFGRPMGSLQAGYTNSAVGFSADTAKQAGGIYRYDKQHLVPFGEFIPTGFRWFTELMGIPLGDFTRGPKVAASFQVKGERVAPNICYEDLFGEELALRFVDEPVAPTMFANLSNIGWFGDSIALRQHLNISRMRAKEFQRPMLRSTNTGSTAIIDHTGRVTHQLDPLTRGVLEGSVQGRSGLTPYVRWVSQWGVWPLVGFALAVLLLLLPLRRQD